MCPPTKRMRVIGPMCLGYVSLLRNRDSVRLAVLPVDGAAIHFKVLHKISKRSRAFLMPQAQKSFFTIKHFGFALNRPWIAGLVSECSPH